MSARSTVSRATAAFIARRRFNTVDGSAFDDVLSVPQLTNEDFETYV